jgi:hypothetical protein
MLEPKLIDGKYVEIIIDEKFANKHGETLKKIYSCRGFRSSVIEELCKIATEELDVDFDSDGSELYDVYPKKNGLAIVLKVKSNIVYFENEYVEQERIVDGYLKILNHLPDERIHLGLMTTEKKKEELLKLRTDRDYLATYLKDNGILD